MCHFFMYRPYLLFVDHIRLSYLLTYMVTTNHNNFQAQSTEKYQAKISFEVKKVKQLVRQFIVDMLLPTKYTYLVMYELICTIISAFFVYLLNHRILFKIFLLKSPIIQLEMFFASTIVEYHRDNILGKKSYIQHVIE